MFFTLYDLHTFSSRSSSLRFSVESIVEEVGLGQLLDGKIARLSLSLSAWLTAATVVAATLASAATTWPLARVSANLFDRSRLSLLLLLSGKCCCSGCPSSSCSCGSCSGCSDPDSSQASQSSGLSSGVAGISESLKLYLSRLLKSHVSQANRSQPAKLFLVGPGRMTDLNEFEPALSSGNSHIPSRSGSLAPQPFASDPHQVLLFGPPDETCRSSSCEPAQSDGFLPVCSSYAIFLFNLIFQAACFCLCALYLACCCLLRTIHCLLRLKA